MKKEDEIRGLKADELLEKVWVGLEAKAGLGKPAPRGVVAAYTPVTEDGDPDLSDFVPVVNTELQVQTPLQQGSLTLGGCVQNSPVLEHSFFRFSAKGHVIEIESPTMPSVDAALFPYEQADVVWEEQSVSGYVRSDLAGQVKVRACDEEMSVILIDGNPYLMLSREDLGSIPQDAWGVAEGGYVQMGDPIVRLPKRTVLFKADITAERAPILNELEPRRIRCPKTRLLAMKMAQAVLDRQLSQVALRAPKLWAPFKESDSLNGEYTPELLTAFAEAAARGIEIRSCFGGCRRSHAFEDKVRKTHEIVFTNGESMEIPASAEEVLSDSVDVEVGDVVAIYRNSAGSPSRVLAGLHKDMQDLLVRNFFESQLEKLEDGTVLSSVEFLPERLLKKVTDACFFDFRTLRAYLDKEVGAYIVPPVARPRGSFLVQTDLPMSDPVLDLTPTGKGLVYEEPIYVEPGNRLNGFHSRKLKGSFTAKP